MISWSLLRCSHLLQKILWACATSNSISRDLLMLRIELWVFTVGFRAASTFFKYQNGLNISVTGEHVQQQHEHNRGTWA